MRTEKKCPLCESETEYDLVPAVECEELVMRCTRISCDWKVRMTNTELRAVCCPDESWLTCAIRLSKDEPILFKHWSETERFAGRFANYEQYCAAWRKKAYGGESERAKPVGLDIDDQCEIPLEAPLCAGYRCQRHGEWQYHDQDCPRYNTVIAERVILPNGQTVTVDSEPKLETWRDREPLL